MVNVSVLEFSDDLSIITDTKLSQRQKVKILGDKADTSICQQYMNTAGVIGVENRISGVGTV